jgi:hypothetical protein
VTRLDILLHVDVFDLYCGVIWFGSEPKDQLPFSWQLQDNNKTVPRQIS